MINNDTSQTSSAGVWTHTHAPASSWIVCLSAALFFFYAFIQMSMFDAISSDLMQSFHITGAQLAALSSLFLYGNMLCLYPAGILSDYYSTKKIILWAMGVCVVSTFFFAFSTTFTFATISHFITGCSNAFCFLTCLILASRWFPARQLALVTGVIVTLAMLGGAVAHTPFSLLAQTVGWRYTMIVNGVLGIVLFFVIKHYVQDAPKNGGFVHHVNPPFSMAVFLRQVKHSLSNGQNWKSGIFISTLNAPLMVLGALWGSLYLQQTSQLTVTQATTVSSMIYIGTIVGSPLFGALSDHWGRRKPVMVLGACLSLLTLLPILLIHPLNFYLALSSFFALGFFTSAQILGYPVIADSNPPSLTGTSLGLGSMLVMGGAGLFQQLFGLVIDSVWDHSMVAGAPIYTLRDYEISFLIFPIALLVGLGMALGLRETFCKPMSE